MDGSEVSVSTVTVSARDDNLETATSVLTIKQPRHIHNGQMFDCRAPPPAMVEEAMGDSGPVNQSFKLSVQCE